MSGVGIGNWQMEEWKVINQVGGCGGKRGYMYGDAIVWSQTW